MVDDYTLDKVLDKVKRIGIKELGDARILIDKDDKFSYNINLKNDVILMRCVIEVLIIFIHNCFRRSIVR